MFLMSAGGLYIIYYFVSKQHLFKVSFWGQQIIIMAKSTEYGYTVKYTKAHVTPANTHYYKSLHSKSAVFPCFAGGYTMHLL